MASEPLRKETAQTQSFASRPPYWFYVCRKEGQVFVLFPGVKVDGYAVFIRI
jgi:hypothetical protein